MKNFYIQVMVGLGFRKCFFCILIKFVAKIIEVRDNVFGNTITWSLKEKLERALHIENVVQMFN
jgi:hypothetical protein